jgi:8-oxo-dGTP pyrophosphatase MutT (NUDIX family)
VAPAAVANRSLSDFDESAVLARLQLRLHGTSLAQRASATRIGAGVHLEIDAQLRSLMPAETRAAAVLVPLCTDVAGAGILLTVRADHLRHHAGQIAFPGGVLDAADQGPAQAALREASEEVGLHANHATILGYLGDQIVLTGYRITPVVASIAPGFSPRLDPREVVTSFVLPWKVLMDENQHHRHQRTIGGIQVMTRELQYEGHRIWGATAGILFALRDVVLE